MNKYFIFANFIFWIMITSCGEDGPANNTPLFSDRTFSIPEEIQTGDRVGLLAAFDPDGDQLSYSIISGNLDNTFALNTSTGELTINSNANIDFQTTSKYQLSVEVSDGKAIAAAIITINVEEGNRPPIIDAQTFSVAEDAVIGLSIGTIQATDPNGGNLKYTILSGNTDDLFQVTLSNGELKLGSTLKLDHETKDSYTLTILVEDPAKLTSSAPITIDILDVDEPNASFELAETNFTMKDGLIRELGITNVSAFHYARTYALADGEYSFSEATGNFVVTGGTIGVFGVLFSKGLFSFNPGEFIYIDTATTRREDVLGIAFIHSGAIIIDGNNDGSVSINEEDIVYGITGGSVKVIPNGGGNPTLNYNVEVTLYDVKSKQYINASKANLHFEYTGDFKFSDERGRDPGNIKLEQIIEFKDL
ncbi:MAG: cadherin repeat domain-containing protein [Ekhidna sp.]